MSPSADRAIVLRVNNGRFFAGTSKTGRVQTAWSVAGAKLFGDWQTDKIEKAERQLFSRGKMGKRMLLLLGPKQ